MNLVLLSGGSGQRLWPLSYDIRSKQFIKLNPMYWYITGFRRTLMWGIPLDINMFLVCGLCALISMLIGVQMFRKTQDRFVLHI